MAWRAWGLNGIGEGGRCGLRRGESFMGRLGSAEQGLLFYEAVLVVMGRATLAFMTRQPTPGHSNTSSLDSSNTNPPTSSPLWPR